MTFIFHRLGKAFISRRNFIRAHLPQVLSFPFYKLQVRKAALYAAAGWPTGGIAGVTNKEKLLELLLCNLARYAFMVLMVLATLLALWAAYIYLASGGDEEKVKRATKTITYAAVAVVVGLLAWGFPFIVASIFATTDLTQVCRF